MDQKSRPNVKRVPEPGNPFEPGCLANHYVEDATLAEMVPEVYQEMRMLAAQLLRHHRNPDAMQTTSLLHETYIRLASGKAKRFKNQGHFLAVAAKAMRYILTDFTRRRIASKRGGGQKPTSTDPDIIISEEMNPLLPAIDEALVRLAKVDLKKARVVELRLFGGLTIEEAAKVLEVSPMTIKRDWRLAKAWLFREINK